MLLTTAKTTYTRREGKCLAKFIKQFGGFLEVIAVEGVTLENAKKKLNIVWIGGTMTLPTTPW